MKKVLSIISVLIIILAGLQVTVSSHYCGGEPVASKISLSGTLASCGMEDNEENCPLPWHQVTSDCCETMLRFPELLMFSQCLTLSGRIRVRIS